MSAPKPGAGVAMNRRNTIKALAAGAAAAALAPASGQAADNPDAELIASCDRYVALHAAYNAAFKEPGLTIEREEQIDLQMAPVQIEAEQLLESITHMRATTAAGVAAIARVASADSDAGDRDPTNEELYITDRILAVLMRDAGRLA